MLAIRLQRQGRKGYATYRFIVQESKLSPTSEKVVARIGSYDPHTKKIILDKEKASFYLENGAQPSDSMVRIFNSEKVKMPAWVEKPKTQKRSIKNPDKLRKNQPKEEKPVEEEPKPEEPAEDRSAAEVPASEEKPAEKTNDSSEKTSQETKPE